VSWVADKRTKEIQKTFVEKLEVSFLRFVYMLLDH